MRTVGNGDRNARPVSATWTSPSLRLPVPPDEVLLLIPPRARAGNGTYRCRSSVHHPTPYRARNYRPPRYVAGRPLHAVRARQSATESPSFSPPDTRRQRARVTFPVSPSFTTFGARAAASQKMIRKTMLHPIPPSHLHSLSCNSTNLLRLY